MTQFNPESPTNEATEMVSRYFRRPVHKKGREWLEDHLGQQRLFQYNPAQPLHIVSIDRGKYGVFMFNQLLKQFSTKAAATKHLNSLKAKAMRLQKNPGEFYDDEAAAAVAESFEEAAPLMVAIKTGGFGEVVSETETGDYLVQLQGGGFDVFPGEDLSVTNEPELVENGIVGRYWARRKAGKAVRKELRLEAALDRARRAKAEALTRSRERETKDASKKDFNRLLQQIRGGKETSDGETQAYDLAIAAGISHSKANSAIDAAFEKGMKARKNPALETNPALVRKIGNYYQIQLPNRKFLRDGGGAIWKTHSLKQAREVAAQTKLDARAELDWLRSLHISGRPRRNPMHPLSLLANLGVAASSAFQVHDRLTRKQPIKRVIKKVATRRNPVMLKNKTQFKAELEKVLRRKLTTSAKDKKYLNDFYASYRKSIQAVNDKHAPRKNPSTTAKPKAKANPQKIGRRKAFEMFQGRPATNARPMLKSKHAPNNLEQLGDLVEIKLASGETMNFERRRNGRAYYPFKLTMNPRATRLWIAGGKFTRKNPHLGDGQIEIIEPIEHVVYATYKPHIEGDEIVRHYIHQLADEGGEMPHLGVDNEGYPIIHGGSYYLKAEGIRD